jgi:hypothetical protein
MTVNHERLVSGAYLRDQDEFVRRWVRQYYRTCVEAIRRHDPNHLILGIRWGGPPDPVVTEVESHWTDVISMNRYRAEIVEAFHGMYARLGRPMLIGECCHLEDSYYRVRNPIEPPGGYEDETARRDIRTQDAFNRVATHPGIVGYTFYAWKTGSMNDQEARPLWQANRRAAYLRASREAAPPRPPFRPLHGQLFVSLLGWDVFRLGLVCREGVFDREVYGSGLRGEVLKAEVSDEEVRLSARFRMIRGMFALHAGSGEFEIRMKRVSEEEWEGTFRGTRDGEAMEGNLLAYLHRPLPHPGI